MKISGIWRFYSIILLLFAVSSVTALEDESGLDREIGQMILVGFRGTEAPPDSAIRRAIREVKIGGVILFDVDVPAGRAFPRNIADPVQTKKLIADLQKDARIPLFIAVDVEGGKVNRLKPQYGFADIPGAQEVGAQNDLAAAREAADAIARELCELGFNMDFAPVVDVNVNPDNPVIGRLGRSFSNDPAKVARYASVYISALRKRRIVSVLKHFPGHGSSVKDSHVDLVDVTDTYSQDELIPYEILLRDSQVACIMTAHIMNRHIDKDYPATLSPTFIKNLLRGKLRYNGLIISDDLHMQAVASRFSLGEAAVMAVNAGCDIVLASNNGREYDDALAFKIRDAILQAVKDGTIPRERIREAAGRVSVVKKKFLDPNHRECGL